MSKTSDSALAIALEIQKRVAALGFDWPDATGPRAKVIEELAELERAAGNAEKLNEELGDLLFAVVNLARHLDVEPEQALAAANQKFQHRFRYIEQRLATEGLYPQDVNLARLDALWNEAKRQKRTVTNPMLPKASDE
ncbi:MAG: MazG nucleotide pyrophosphohydrolase domain-containing protein [Gammaproteobacteria bacterium]